MLPQGFRLQPSPCLFYHLQKYLPALKWTKKCPETPCSAFRPQPWLHCLQGKQLRCLGQMGWLDGQTEPPGRAEHTPAHPFLVLAESGPQRAGSGPPHSPVLRLEVALHEALPTGMLGGRRGAAGTAAPILASLRGEETSGVSKALR